MAAAGKVWEIAAILLEFEKPGISRKKNMKVKVLVLIGLVVLLGLCGPISAQTRPILVQNASVIDGSGIKAFTADIRIKNGKVNKIGKIKPKKRDEIIDAYGLVLTPGFIDIHNHSESGLVTEGSAANQVSQGITTVMVGPDGGSPLPIGEYFSQINGKIAINLGAFVGHGTLRATVMEGSLAREATEEEIVKMMALLKVAMKDGAFGLSSGLEYDAGFSASTAELIRLARVASKYGGIYMTHLRDEEEGLLTAINEAIRIGREARIPVQISHIKAGNRNVWGKSTEAIALIESARRSGLDITADAYPYTAWASTITVLVSSRRHEDRAEIDRGLNDVGGADKVLVTRSSAHRDYEGKTLLEIAKANGVSPSDVYIEIVKDGGASVVCNSMNEADVKAFYQQSWVMVSSDGGIGSRHPRGTGTFTKVLGRFVRDEKFFGLEEAVRKMTSFPAARLGLRNRGLIKKGMRADLVLFDAKNVVDRATFSDPQRLSEGIRLVFVNGEKVWADGRITGSLPGKILKN